MTMKVGQSQLSGDSKQTAIHHRREAARQAAPLINQVFRELLVIFPAWKNAVTDRAKAGEWAREYRAQLIKAMVENGVNSQEMLEHGLMVARKERGDFLPGTGKFVGWCKSCPMAYKPAPRLSYDAMTPEQREEKMRILRKAFVGAGSAGETMEHMQKAFDALRNGKPI